MMKASFATIALCVLSLAGQPPAQAGSFNCTGPAPAANVKPPSNPYTRYNIPTLAPGSVFDARGDTFRLRHSSNPDPMGDCRYKGVGQLPTNPYAIMNDPRGGTINACFQGGKVLGELSPLADQTVWAGPSGKYCNSAAVTMANDASTRQIVEGTRMDKVWDGIRIYAAKCLTTPGACRNEVRDVWVSNARDDCVENDSLGGLLVTNSLFDGCFSGISSDPGGCTNCPASHRTTDEIVVDRVLLRLHAFPYKQVTNGITVDHIGPFKIHATMGPAVVVRNSVIAFNNVDNPKRYAAWKAGFGAIKTCSNNFLLWLPDTPFPTAKLPPVPSCFTIKTGAAARKHWNDARTAWIAAHPDIERIAGDSVSAVR